MGQRIRPGLLGEDRFYFSVAASYGGQIEHSWVLLFATESAEQIGPFEQCRT